MRGNKLILSTFTVLIISGGIALYLSNNHKSDSTSGNTDNSSVYEKITLKKEENPKTIDNIHGKEYYEYFLVYRTDDGLKGAVYNNVNTQIIPKETWESYNDNEIANNLDALKAIKNGPRFWTVDGVTGYESGGIESFDGYDMTLVGVLDMTIKDIRNRQPYQEHHIDRHTDWYFNKGTTVYKLYSDEGDTYIMQAASREINSSLSFDDLKTLSSELDLPKGWRYEVEILESDYILETRGNGSIIQDDFNNTYQKMSE